MKALVLKSIGNLVYEDVPTPVPKEGEVLLEVKACGICSSDFNRCLKTGTYHFPTIPGHEFSGRIIEVGDNVDTSLMAKDAVVFPLLPCRECDQCRLKAYARCRNYNYFGSRCDGAFAEYIAVPVWNLQLFEGSLDYKVAALCEPAAVAYHAVSTAVAGSTGDICIIGTGTIGILAGFWAREFGSGVTFITRNERKHDLLTRLGFHTVDALQGGVDISSPCVLECVGSDESVTNAIECVATSGKIILIGNPDGDKRLSQKVYWKILRKELTIKGVWNSCYGEGDNEWRKVLDLLVKWQKVLSQLITSVFPLEVGQNVFELLRKSDKLEIKGMFVNE